MSWAVLARLGRVSGVLWVRLGASEGVLEASWGHLGASWEDLGAVLGSLGGFLGPFWEHFRKIFCHLEQYAKIQQKPRKTYGFSLIFEVL